MEGWGRGHREDFGVLAACSGQKISDRRLWTGQVSVDEALHVSTMSWR